MARIVRREEAERGGLRVTRLVSPAGPAQPQEPGEAHRGEVLAEQFDEQCEERLRGLVQAMLRGFAQQRRELLTELQPYVVRIAVEVARRIVRRELRTDPGLITSIARAALEQIGAAANVRVRVHPHDAQILQQSILQLADSPDEAGALQIVPDGSIERGGCLVESDRGIVDARLQTQFEAMQISLLQSLEPPEQGGRA